MKYCFPIHLDGGNRGCEAIARSTALLLEQPIGNMLGYCRNVELDTQLGLAQYYTLVPCRPESRLLDKIYGLSARLSGLSRVRAGRILYPYRPFLQMIDSEDVVFITGGDMMCYDDNELLPITHHLFRRGVPTVLWGCSMGQENQTPAKLRALQQFSFIYARESLTYEYFQTLGLKHTCLFPDPAFILPPQPCQLPQCFSQGQVLGINVSNYITGGMSLRSPFATDLLQLIHHVLQSTSLHVLLIPHVTWNTRGNRQDDRQLAQLISQHISSPRLHVLSMDALNYCQLRYVISQCHLFMGARTHSVISAYATCVPTLALGYSVKARGIARDCGLPSQLVVDTRCYASGMLGQAFGYLLESRDELAAHLKRVIPSYTQQVYGIRKHISQLKNHPA